MMESLRYFLGTRSRIKTGVLTFICLSAVLILLQTWRSDSWPTLRDHYHDLTSSDEAGSTPVELVVGDSVAPGAAIQSPGVITGPSATVDQTAQDNFGKDPNTESTSSPTLVVSGEAVIDEVKYDSKSTIDATSVSEPATTLLPAIVAAAMKAEDVRWMKEFTDTHEIFPYIVTAWFPKPRLTIPANKGREAMTYLSYLIDNYENLPPYAIFTHGHLTAWHQKIDIRKMIRDLRVDALEEVGYVSFRCSWIPSCPAELRPVDHDAVLWGDGLHVRETEEAIATAWPDLFPGVEIPRTIASPCCAQFAVTRKAMMRRSKEDYIRLRQWLLETKLDDEVSGRVMEKLWAYMMTDEPVHCPSPNRCACKYFGSCGWNVFPQPPSELGPLPED